MKNKGKTAQKVALGATSMFTKTASAIGNGLLGIGKGVFTPMTRTDGQFAAPIPGAAPGIEQYLKTAAEEIPIRITVIDYGHGRKEVHTFESVEAALSCDRPSEATVRWLNVDGLRPSTISAVCQQFGVHTLAAEDVINTFQRPKVEVFDNHLSIIVRQIQIANNTLKNEQISFFLFSDTLISFQEEAGDVFDSVRKRLENPNGRFATYKADYLFYALIDSIVDHLFPILEAYGAALEELEFEILERPVPASQQKLFSMRRDLSLQRRALWPIREVIDSLYRDESNMINDDLKTFYRDVQDHTMQVLDLLETYRDTASGLSDLYQSSVGNKMNEIMKVLTIMASFFIPTTFIAGVYGMNFQYIPELQYKYAYPVFWGICLSMTAGLAIYFWRKGWIGGR